MSSEPDNATCRQHRDALLRLACGDANEVEGELASHLELCPACRAVLESTGTLVESLRAALRPEPLPEGLAEQIRQRRASGRRGAVSRRLVAWRLAGAAIAAGLLAAALIPWPVAGTPQSAPARAGLRVTLSDQEAAELVAAYALLAWEAPAEYTLPTLKEGLDKIARTVERQAGTTGLLPWNRENDWDVPVAPDESSRCEPMRPLCAIRAAGDQAAPAPS